MSVVVIMIMVVFSIVEKIIFTHAHPPPPISQNSVRLAMGKRAGDLETKLKKLNLRLAEKQDRVRYGTSLHELFATWNREIFRSKVRGFNALRNNLVQAVMNERDAEERKTAAKLMAQSQKQVREITSESEEKVSALSERCKRIEDTAAEEKRGLLDQMEQKEREWVSCICGGEEKNWAGE